MCITSILNIWWIYERGGRCRMAEWLVQISSFWAAVTDIEFFVAY